MSVTASAEQLNRLPKWARDEIMRLQSNLARANTQIEALIGTAPSSIEVDPHRTRLDDGKKRTFLPKGTRVLYTIPGGEVTIYIRDEQIELQATGHHGEEFVVRPRASNMIWAGFATEEKTKNEKAQSTDPGHAKD